MKVKNQVCIRRLSYRTLKASRKKHIIAILAIALTTLLFTSLFTIAGSINNSYQTYTFRQIGGYAHGTFKDVDADQIAAISAHSKVRKTGLRTVIGYLDTGVFAKLPAEVSFMDANCTKWSYASPTTGRAPERGKEISMDTTGLQLLGITPKIGAQIELTWRVGTKDGGSTYEKTDTFTLTGWWDYDDLSPVHYINISEEYAKEVETEAQAHGITSFRSDLNVMMKSSVNIQGQMEQVDTDLGYDWEDNSKENCVRIGVNWGYTSAQLGQTMDVQTLIAMIAFLLLIIFTGYLIIYNIFQISVTEDIRFYGLLKTIGVTPRQLRRIIRWQALFLSAAGIPIGLLLGYVAGAVLTPIVIKNTTFGTVSTSLSNSPLIFLGSALFALLTVFFSAFRPGRMAGKVSPIEAVKYTDTGHFRKKKRQTRGAKVYQMAYANLGRNKSKTFLVIISLSLSVVLLNILVTLTGGFDMDRYLAKQTCADFIVSNTDYFRFRGSNVECISRDTITQIQEHTTASLSGCAYTPSVQTSIWISEQAWRDNVQNYLTEEEFEQSLQALPEKNGLVQDTFLLEGMDDTLIDRLTVLEGNLEGLRSPDNSAIAFVVHADDYGHASVPDSYPAIGDSVTMSYGTKDITYKVCAYVTVPYSMSYRFSTLGYEAVISADAMEKDSGTEIYPLLYLFDTPDGQAEQEAEQYLSELTSQEMSDMMYESKAVLRADFENFRHMFLLIGGLLCGIIGLVGILNFFNAVMTGILARKKEFAVLQSIGMTRKQMQNMLIYESLFYTMGSSVIALVLSILLYVLTGHLMETMLWFFQSHFTILPVLLTIPVFLLLGIVIPSVVYRQTVRHSIVEQLRDLE